MKNWRLVSVLVLAIAGAAVAVHLTSIHYGHVCHGVPGSCAFRESNRCDEVNTSEWSELLGIPVAHLGMLTHLFVFGVAFAALVRPGMRPRAHAYLFLTAIWCVMFSAWMASIAIFKIGKLCDWCVSLYVINFLTLCILWAGGFRAAYGLPEHLAEESRWLRRRPGALFAAVCVAAIAGSCVHLRTHLDGCRKEQIEKRFGIDTTGRPSIGPESARVAVVEISDFECPFCRKASGTLANVLDGYRGKVKLVFMHFPLDNACNPAINRAFHRNACLAARAAWCAGSRGFFWKYAKTLFEGALDRPALIKTAKGAGLDPAAFEACLDSKEAADAIARDIDAGMAINVHKEGVPYFLVNGRKIVGAVPPAKFKELIDAELAGAH
ncbi:MAG: thioredoxin domain-containing protein [Deltaproteobacteria bacterium]|nr:thioredoxin domain-containing protein [Deltaproteobacteria bacterium]